MVRIYITVSASLNDRKKTEVSENEISITKYNYDEQNMKKLIYLCMGLLLLSSSALADDHHAVVALEQATAAVIYGKGGHTSVLLEHARTALEHALAASITAKGLEKSHFDEAVTELQETIDLGESGHVGTATKHAQAAVRQLKANSSHSK